MFSQDSPKLPVSANFMAQPTSDGKTVELSIQPSSIIVPHKELPKSPKKLRSKARRREAATVHKSNQDRLSSIINKRERYRQALPKKQKEVVRDRHNDPEPDRNQLEI
jgi:hypothetical protein